MLLLAFVLPLQMSWGATHFCDDDLSPVTVTGLAAPDSHKHSKTADAGKKSESKKADLADCCGAAHGCHGLHHLIAPGEAVVAPALTAEAVGPPDQLRAYGVLATRVERPKWLAA